MNWLCRLVNAGAAHFLIGLVRTYQATLNPLLGGACRFTPSCSEYFLEAVRQHGPWRGGWKGLCRLRGAIHLERVATIRPEANDLDPRGGRSTIVPSRLPIPTAEPAVRDRETGRSDGAQSRGGVTSGA